MAAALPMAIATLGSGAMNYFGNQSAANTQANATNNAAQAGLQGTREGIQFQRDIYNTDQQREYDAGQYLKGLMPNFDMSTIDPTKYFGEGNVNAQWDLAKTGLNRQYQNDLSTASTAAGESAASRGLLNPSLMQRSATNDVRQTYAPQFTNLEAGRAGALNSNNKDLFAALMQNKNFTNMLRQMQYGNQFQLASNFGSPNANGNTMTGSYMGMPANPYQVNYDPNKMKPNSGGVW